MLRRSFAVKFPTTRGLDIASSAGNVLQLARTNPGLLDPENTDDHTPKDSHREICILAARSNLPYAARCFDRDSTGVISLLYI